MRPARPRSATAAALVLSLLPVLVPGPVRAQDWDAIEVETVPVAGNVSMITGGGGNVAVSAGADGFLVVDDLYPPMAPRLLDAIRALGPAGDGGRIRYVVNTHFHQDHTGGNAALAGAGAVVVAHPNVRRRLAAPQVVERWGSDPMRFDAAPAAGLPTLTFRDELSLRLNGDVIHVIHVPRAHTDGDAIVWFEGADVVHMGDTFWNGMYPFIDVSSGGTVDGFLAAQGRALALMDADTRVVPGHGPLGTREELRTQRDALRAIRDRVAASKAAGRSVEEIVAERPTRDFDARLGGGFISPESLIHAIFDSLPPGGR